MKPDGTSTLTKLEKLSPEQRRLLSSWLRNRRISYSRIRTRFKKQFGFDVSSTWLFKVHRMENPEGDRRKPTILEGMPGEQLDALISWIRNPALGYAEIKKLAMDQFGVNLSSSSLTRAYRKFNPIPKRSDGAAFTVEFTIAIFRNGEQQARSQFVVPLQGGRKALPRHKALKALANRLN